MKIKFSPQGNNILSLDALSKNGDVLMVNGMPYDLSAIPDGATLPNAEAATGCEYIRGSIERIDSELHITLLLPHGPLPQPQEVLFPVPITVSQDGPISIPGVQQ